ncbi:hypothetical protein RO3G_07150 [Rhizopus delemar RA 99-880]|uniref:Uncharacterized protein n=1 Tax=Rhizopus delemar (strain RA 99-880 / ATCC MYA-4621 / FGSC 9543 / NRRL 43880) TaxID=246409 RepID=I1C1W5_RHIO9|nr:hypothetical protein RO3G_07150 [Rhizopus delemar RA 99-880]|eukprot:EIE82445.1 hypothetical protein RO3G_07150 [Rhizopus delemar RA 99-880]
MAEDRKEDTRNCPILQRKDLAESTPSEQKAYFLFITSNDQKMIRVLSRTLRKTARDGMKKPKTSHWSVQKYPQGDVLDTSLSDWTREDGQTSCWVRRDESESIALGWVRFCRTWPFPSRRVRGRKRRLNPWAVDRIWHGML